MDRSAVENLKTDFFNKQAKYGSYVSIEAMRAFIAAEQKSEGFSNTPSFLCYIIKREDLSIFLDRLKKSQVKEKYHFHLLLKEKRNYINLDILWSNTIKKACVFNISHSDTLPAFRVFIELYRMPEFTAVFSVSSNSPEVGNLQNDYNNNAIFALYIAIQAAKHNVYEYFQSHFPNEIHLSWWDLPTDFIRVSQSLLIFKLHAKKHNIALYYAESSKDNKIKNYREKYEAILSLTALGNWSNTLIETILRTQYDKTTQWLQHVDHRELSLVFSDPLEAPFPWERADLLQKEYSARNQTQTTPPSYPISFLHQYSLQQTSKTSEKESPGCSP